MRLRRIDTVDVPAHACEIIAWCASQRLLLSTNALWKTLDIFEADSLNPPRLRALDFCPSEPWVGGFWTVGEPTSVAVHPKEPVAFVTALSRLRHRRGRLTAFDLRAGSRGRTLFDLEVGYHPDSVAVSPDGRWAIVACEAECHPDLPGTICAVDLSGLKLDGDWRPDPEACFELTDMAERLDVPPGELEPEFVAFDPASRFAVVTCQENDAAFLVDVRGGRPEVAGVIFLGFLSRPDGAAVLDDIPGPDGRRGCLIAIAEEGGFDAHAGRICGQALTCFWVDPEDLARPVQVSRVDVRPLLDPEEPQKRRDPEGVSLVRLGTRIYGALAVERGDRLMCFDLSDPTAPDLVGAVRIGDRPEGLIAIPDGEGVLFVTGEEGKYGPGTLSFTRLEPVE
jgi:DNA-binding beta-propeller fold protein YncE